MRSRAEALILGLCAMVLVAWALRFSVGLMPPQAGEPEWWRAAWLAMARAAPLLGGVTAGVVTAALARGAEGPTAIALVGAVLTIDAAVGIAALFGPIGAVHSPFWPFGVLGGRPEAMWIVPGVVFGVWLAWLFGRGPLRRSERRRLLLRWEEGGAR